MGGEQSGSSPSENFIFALNYWSNIAWICLLLQGAPLLLPASDPQHAEVKREPPTQWARHNQLMFHAYFLPICFYYKLKKESDTIRNCSSNSPIPRGSTENRSLHLSSERFIIHLQGVQIRYKIGKIIKYRQERKHYIYTSSEPLIISILLKHFQFYIENKFLLWQWNIPKCKIKHLGISKGHQNTKFFRVFPPH